MIYPSRMLRKRGHSTVMSFPALSVLAEMFVSRVERANAKDVKSVAARLPHLSIDQFERIPENFAIEGEAHTRDGDAKMKPFTPSVA